MSDLMDKAAAEYMKGNKQIAYNLYLKDTPSWYAMSFDKFCECADRGVNNALAFQKEITLTTYNV